MDRRAKRRKDIFLAMGYIAFLALVAVTLLWALDIL
jgi:hypothetical protein